MRANKFAKGILPGVVALILLVGLLPLSGASALQNLPQGVQEERVTDPASGRLIFLSLEGDQDAAGDVSAAGLSPEQSAQAYIERYAPAFGLSNPAQQLTLESLRSLKGGGYVARYQQMYAGVPVFGGVLQVKTRANGALDAVSGNVQPDLGLSVTPSLDAERAAEIARQRIALTQKISPESLNLFSEPTLWIYDARLFDDNSTAAPRLVWEVKLDAGLPSLWVALVDAQNGVTRLEFQQRRPQTAAAAAVSPAGAGDSLQALVAGQAQWRICTSAFTTFVDCNMLVLDNDGVTHRSSLLCTQDDPSACDDLWASAADAVRVYPAIESAYHFFYDRFGRDGWDGNGTAWDAHVNYSFARSDPQWSPSVMHASGNNAAFADTVVAHDLVAREYAYDVLFNDAGLLNIYQSGAVAESLADMWGEFIDQSVTLPAGLPDNDAVSVRWLIGEDVFPGTPVQYFRNMKTPTLKLHPDNMASPYYYKGALEYGRPTVNNGVNNKAVFLMVDGGSFGGLTVTPLGMAKTAAVYYGAQQYLFPSADYYDLYVALKASCNDLIGTQPVGATTPISSADCLNVDKALKAVKMNTKPATLSSVPVPACPTGTEKGEVLFADNFDSGDLSAWTFQANEYHVTFDALLKKVTIDEIIPIDDQASWTTLDGALTDDGKALYAPGIAALSQLDTIPPNYRVLDYADEMAMPVNEISLPAGKQIYLTFDHMFLFELTQITFSPYDGGVVEYSKDGGVTWLDAKPLFNLGYNYNGTVATSGRDPFTFNPLMGRMAFVKNSLSDRVATRYNLSTLAGQNIRLRWRIGYDYDTYWGWAIDNVSLHTCIKVPSIPYLLTPVNNALILDSPEGVYKPRLDWKDSIPDLAYYQVQVAKDSKFTDLVYDQIVVPSEFTPPDSLEPNTRYYWRVKAFNINGRSLNWSTARYFRTAMLRPENLSLPADGAEVKTRRPNFDWDDPNTIGAPATNYTIQIARQPDFAAISLAATYTTPSNATYFTATSDLPANTLLYWRVKANGTNPSQYSSEVKSFRTGNPPPVPVLVAPANNALIQPVPVPLEDPSAWQYQPYLDWNIVTVPAGVTFDRYEVQVSDTPDFSNLIVDEDIPDINHHYYQVTTPLASNTVYYWRVQSIAGGEDFSNWATRSFRTALLPPQTLLKPDDGQPAHTRRPTFEWTPVAGATGYTIQVSTLPTFALVQYTYTITKPVSTYTHTADVAANTMYYWRIRSNGPNGPGLYSAAHSFVSGNPPTAPSLLAPAQNILLTVYTPTLDWGASVPALGTTFDRYEVQWADNPNFDAAEVRDVPGVTNHLYVIQPGEALSANKTYYWRVRAWNTDGDFSAWSVVRYFRTAMLAPTLVYPIVGNNVVNTLQPVLDWDEVDGAVTYNVQISLYANMGSPLLNINTVDATSAYMVPSGKLQYGKTYYWRVRANGPNGPGLWSAIETFQPLP